MDTKNRKIVYIFMACATAVLLLCRHIYAADPAIQSGNLTLLRVILRELIALTTAIILSLCLEPYRSVSANKSKVFLIVCGSVIYVACYAYVIFNFDNILKIGIADNIRQAIPFIGIIPATMAYFLQEDKNSRRSKILIFTIMAVIGLTSAVLVRTIAGIYAMLAVMAVLFAIDGAAYQSYDWKYTMMIVIVAIASTVIAYLISGCSCVEHFVIAQYERTTAYVEGPWDSAAIFDGRLVEAISTCGLLSGSRTELNMLYTGCYGAPVNMLLAYGWLPFILHLLSSIVIAAGCYVIVWDMRDETFKNIGMLIAPWITVSTICAYFLFPRMIAPLGLAGNNFDFDIMWLVLLLVLAAEDHKKTEREKEPAENNKICAPNC